MKLAIISDLHADLHALRDALLQIDRLGCDVIVCAGDIVDIGVFPEETIALLIEHGIPTIRGNHDRWAIGTGSANDPCCQSTDEHDASAWDLSEGALTFLRSLPLSWSATLDGVRVAVHHAAVGNDMHGIYRENLDDRVAVGHTHVPFAYKTAAGRIVANPGALLRDGGEQPAWMYDEANGTFARMPPPPRGTFGVLHLPERRFVVHYATDGGIVDDGWRSA